MYASDYPYGRQPASLLLALRTARIAGLDDAPDPRHARGEREPDRRRRAAARAVAAAGADDVHAADGLRAHPPVPLDGDAAPLDAPAGHDRRARARAERERRARTAARRSSTQIRELLDAARDLWRALPEVDDDDERARRRAPTFRLIHLADILAVTAGATRGERRASTSSSAPVGRSLADTLRDDLGLTGRRSHAARGTAARAPFSSTACRTLSCITLVHTVEDREVTTIEGLRDHPLVDAFVRTDALQCGFCTPGQIVSASALVAANPEPTREEIRHAMAGNICRCGAYSEDRGGDPDVARLIRTEKEVEGRYTETWVVVEEDALDQWPEGPRDVVGRPRREGRRARARARRGAVHGRRPAAGDAPGGGAPQPARARARDADRPRAALAQPGRARRDRAGRRSTC